MGVGFCSNFSLCSDPPSKPEVKNYGEFSESSASLEEEEEEEEEPDVFQLSFLERAKTLPVHSSSKLKKPSGLIRKSKSIHSSGRSSLQEKLEQRKNKPKPFIKGEREAKLYAEIVERDTLKHVGDTLRIAEMIVQKTDDIGGELARQGNVINQVNSDMHDTELEVNETNKTLKGMKSIRGKMVNMVRQKKPKVDAYQGFHPNRGSSLRKQRCVSAPVQMEYDRPSKGTNQQQITGGLEQLNIVMDKIKTRSMDISDEMKRQDKQLGEFSNNMSRTQDKIKVQTRIMNSMRKG